MSHEHPANQMPADYVARFEAMKFSLQSMMQQGVRNFEDVMRRAEAVHQFLTNTACCGAKHHEKPTQPEGGSRQASRASG